MQQVKLALESTSSHGLPRTVSNKPWYVRITWLLIFLSMLALFIKGFSEFVVKLQSRQVTTSLDADALEFQFPDAYVCFENPISASYSASMDAETVGAINAQFSQAANAVYEFAMGLDIPESHARIFQDSYSIWYPRSLPFPLLVDALAHRKEHAVIESNVAYIRDTGIPIETSIEAAGFYHPVFLRCMKWNISRGLQKKLLRSKSSTGLIMTLLIDATTLEFLGLPSTRSDISIPIFSKNALVQVPDWPLSLQDLRNSDRRAGVRVFLTPPGEYPSDFATSFTLSPGKHHTVEIDMTHQVLKDGQFDCVRNEPDVLFLNPYDQTPYSHAYSYSYCYYYEYHRQFQSLLNMSGDISPMPWSLRGKAYLTNIYNSIRIDRAPSMPQYMDQVALQTQTACQSRRTCSTLDYSVSISSADWPTQSSLAPFVNSSIKQAWTKAKAKNLSVPALDFLLTGNASSVASYVRSNLLKVHFKPRKRMCDRVTFSFDYGLSNFISDIGGIMEIYLGMSLLTLCELLELFCDVLKVCRCRTKAARSSDVSPKSSEP